MARKNLKFRLTGKSPLLMHNANRLANPLDDLSKEIKKVSSKRKKLDADHERMAELEFVGSLYVMKDNKGNTIPCVPGRIVWAMLRDGAKAVRMGKVFQESVYCYNNFPLEYKGPKSPEELWANPEFRNATLVVVNRAKIMRTRPQFPEWACTIEVEYDEEQVRADQIEEVLKECGRRGMLMDWKGQYGHFVCEKI